MPALVRSELLKLRERTYLAGLVAATAFAVVSMIISVGDAGSVSQDRGPAGLVLSRAELIAADGLGRALSNSVEFIGLALLTLVAINVGAEYTQGTIHNLLVREPRRPRLIAGKALTMLALAFLVTIFSAVAGSVTALAMHSTKGVSIDAWMTSEGVLSTLRGVLNLYIAVSGWMAMGLLLSTASRSAATAIGIAVGYALGVEIILSVALGTRGQWLPGQLLQALARGGTPTMSYTVALAGSLFWIAACTATASAIFSRRDVTA
jgi:ABC-type transport system involved in multi-copper enzyme maturation permease subunit